MRSERGQTNLAALVAALVVLTATVGVTLALADGALASADRSPEERRTAVTATDRLVAGDSPLTRRASVLDDDAIATATVGTVVEAVPPLADAAFRVRLAGDTVVERGDPTDGTAFRRIVVVASAEERTRTVDAADGVTLPRRTATIRLAFGDATVETVRTNGRVVLHRPGGLRGVETVDVSRAETLTLTFDANATGSVPVTYFPERTHKATLAVIVDA
ncbi:hypothetical protein Hbl1158_03045 [Halobaculum sp. CBA1158]|uniref:DUF7263 family protein n=1 Tax=Halobaculum sp. CBA1158 TaxID=2904243 RepID=UPI001F3D2F53|nr:hypothetical protein [Halobaculum sp. CBA1158]UIP00362.1 hypothetical protein Hbl1158_03045 [Halobaculum sp. CBA1158]